MIAAHPTRLLLVTGAAGKTGLAVIRKLGAIAKLLSREAGDPGHQANLGDLPTLPRLPGLRTRALARNADQCILLEEAGVHETVVADLTDPAALAMALQGADCVYHVCPNVHPQEVSIGRRIIALARQAGVHRFVLHSVLQPGIREMPHHWAKRSVETVLAESGLEFTILQPAPYMQNILGQRVSICEQGVYSVPYHLATRVSMVDLEDVAEAVVRVLSSPDGSENSAAHVGATYELCGPELLDQAEIAAVLGRALRREIRAEAVGREGWAKSAYRAGMSRYQVETLLAMFHYYERFGMTGSAQPLQGLLGRPPATFAQFAERTFEVQPG